jgi:hypothetical protein
LERSKLVAEWCELTGENLSQVEAVSGGRGKQSGQREAARQLGVDKEDVRRALKVASLSPEAQDVAREVSANTPESFSGPNFRPAKYTDAQGKPRILAAAAGKTTRAGLPSPLRAETTSWTGSGQGMPGRREKAFRSAATAARWNSYISQPGRTVSDGLAMDGWRANL